MTKPWDSVMWGRLVACMWGRPVACGGLVTRPGPIDNRPHSRKRVIMPGAPGDTATIILTEGVRDRARCVPVRAAHSPVLSFFLPCAPALMGNRLTTCPTLNLLVLKGPLRQIEKLQREVFHSAAEFLDGAAKPVEEDCRRNGGGETQRGSDQSFGNSGRHGSQAGAAGGPQTLKRIDDSPNGAEQTDEGRNRRG